MIENILCPTCNNTQITSYLSSARWKFVESAIMHTVVGDKAKYVRLEVPCKCQQCEDRFTVLLEPVEINSNAWEPVANDTTNTTELNG